MVVLAFTTVRPQALPVPPLPPTFDGQAAARLAEELAATYPDRSPGSPGSLGAARWLAGQLAALNLRTEVDVFSAMIPGRGTVQLRNVVAVVPGRTAEAIVVLAHRDTGAGLPAGDDNASGTAALVELARAYAPSTALAASATGPVHTLVFLSTDGGAYGALGARHFARSSPYAARALAAVSLDAISSPGQPRLEITGEDDRSPSPLLVGTASARLHEQAGHKPGGTGALAQLLDLAFPYSLYEQAPLLARGITALTITRRGARPGHAADDPGSIDAGRLGEAGRAAQALIASLDAGAELARGTKTFWYVAGRAVRGWALKLVLVALLLPFALSVADVAARCRRRRIPLAPAFRSLRSRLLFWLWAAALFALFDAAGGWPDGATSPPSPASEAAGHWPRLSLAAYLALVGASWLLARERLVPRRPVSWEEEVAGQVAALLLLGALAIVVAFANTYLLILLLPSLHAWLWLPQLRGRRGGGRASLMAAGLAAPAFLLGSFAFRFGLGLDTPWYLAVLTAVGYTETVTILSFLVWLAAAAQIVAVEAGRYAPYPGPAERPPGPVRRALRVLLAPSRSRRSRPQV